MGSGRRRHRPCPGVMPAEPRHDRPGGCRRQRRVLLQAEMVVTRGQASAYRPGQRGPAARRATVRPGELREPAGPRPRRDGWYGDPRQAQPGGVRVVDRREPETVERALRGWRQRGIVSTGYRTIVVHDLESLARIARIEVRRRTWNWPEPAIPQGPGTSPRRPRSAKRGLGEGLGALIPAAPPLVG